MDCLTGEGFWPSTLRAVIVCLLVWGVFGMLVPALAPQLNHVNFVGFPLGFYMCAQGSLIAFVILNFVWSFWKDRIDDEAGYTSTTPSSSSTPSPSISSSLSSSPNSSFSSSQTSSASSSSSSFSSSSPYSHTRGEDMCVEMKAMGGEDTHNVEAIEEVAIEDFTSTIRQGEGREEEERRDEAELESGGGDKATVKKDIFSNQIGKVFLLYAGGFILFTLILAFLNMVVGVTNAVIGYTLLVGTIGLYGMIGILARTRDTHNYYVAGQNVPALYNGMATAADWMSGASFVGMAGSIYDSGFQGLAYIVGWTGGFCLVAILIAPFLRKFGCYTVPDFFAERYKHRLEIRDGTYIDLGSFCRMLAILVLLSASFTYLTAQAYSIGMIMSRFLSLDFSLSVFVGLSGILFCSLLGGMRAVTWTQVAQYLILIIAYLLPTIWMGVKEQGSPVPQATYGYILQDIASLETIVRSNYSHDPSSFHSYLETGSQFNFWALTLCLMIGTASLPHVLMRYFTTKSVRSARKSVAYSLLFVFFLYVTAPCYATFTKYEVLKNVIGKPLGDMPEWVYIYGKIEMVKICDANAISPMEVVKACGAKYPSDHVTNQSILFYEDLRIDRDAVVMASPEISDQPYIIAALISAGGLAASLSTADGLLLAIANSLSHDIYFAFFDPDAPPQRRMILSRALLVIIALLAAYVASRRPSDILSMVAWAFSLAASGNFPGLFLGIWWGRANAFGALAGTSVSFFLCAFYLLSTQYLGMGYWFKVGTYQGVPPSAAAVFCLPIGLIVMCVVSLLTPPPCAEVERMVERVRHFDESMEGERTGREGKGEAETEGDGERKEREGEKEKERSGDRDGGGGKETEVGGMERELGVVVMGQREMEKDEEKKGRKEEEKEEERKRDRGKPEEPFLSSSSFSPNADSLTPTSSLFPPPPSSSPVDESLQTDTHSHTHSPPLFFPFYEDTSSFSADNLPNRGLFDVKFAKDGDDVTEI